MPVITHYEYINDNASSQAFMSDLKKDVLSKKVLLNEITVAVNSQEQCLDRKKNFTDRLDRKLRVYKMNSNHYTNNRVIEGKPCSFISKRVLGLIGSVAGLIFTGTVGRSVYRMINQEHPFIGHGVNLLNESQFVATQTAVSGIDGMLISNLLPMNDEVESLSLQNMDSITKDILSSDEIHISLHEYLKEINIIENLSTLSINKLYNMVFHRARRERVLRSVDTIETNKISVADEIINFINDSNFDWRIKNELNGVYVKALDSVEVKNINKGPIKDVRLIIACIGLTLQYLHENKVNNLSKVSFIYGVFFIDRLFLILDGLNSAGLGTVDLRFKPTVKLLISDIYANKDVSGHDDRLSLLREGGASKPMLIDNDHGFFYYAVREHVLPKSAVTTVAPPEDNIKKINLVFCYSEREDLSLGEVLRTISNTIKDPLSTLYYETKIAYNYIINNEGCASDTLMTDIATKVGEVLDHLMSWIPSYSRGRLISLILASSLEFIADAVEEKELSLDVIMEINTYLLNLSKDIFSSLSTKQLYGLEYPIENTNTNTKIKDMMRKLKYKDNKLTVELVNPRRMIYIDKRYHNFVDQESKQVIYYGMNNDWYISEDIRFTHETRNILESIFGSDLEKHDIYLVRNSSPELYADGTMIITNGKTMVIIDNGLYHVSEFHIAEGIYRYVVFDGEIFRPIITSAGKWVFENKHSAYVGEDIIVFCSFNKKVKDRLVSEKIIDADVTPERLSAKVQYDSALNEYIKVNNEYYLFKTGVGSSHYIEGKYDVLPVSFISDKFHIENDILGDMYCIYKKKLNYPSINQRDYYLDSSVIRGIHKKIFYGNSNDLIELDEDKRWAMSISEEVDGGVFIGGKHYLSFDEKLIEISPGGNGIFLLGSVDKIKIYKNSKSNTYYLISGDADLFYKSQRFKIRNFDCVNKQQTSSLCSENFYESRNLATLLKKNYEYSVSVDNSLNSLEPYKNISGFYRDKNSSETLYFLSKDDGFFYAKEEADNDHMIPLFFKLYGKKDNKIDLDILISEVCIIKDFDTGKDIVATPLDAMGGVFNLSEGESTSLLQWQQDKSSRMLFSSSFENLDFIQKELTIKSDKYQIRNFYSLGGKKILSSKKTSDEYISEFIKNKFADYDDFYSESLEDIGTSFSSSLVKEIANDAFDKTKNDILNVISLIRESKYKVEGFIRNKLRMTNDGASSLFLDTLLVKLKRMSSVFDESNKSNIIFLITKENSGLVGDDVKSNKNIIGFAYPNDPLDRIYIKTDFIDFKGYNTLSGVFRTQKIKEYAEKMSDIMLHESIHVLGHAEGYSYHKTDIVSYYDPVDESLFHVEFHIKKNRDVSDEFTHICKLYFMNNPVYNSFDLESLLKPENLALLFHYDDYLRGIILINTPDTLSALIHGLATMNQPVL